MLQQQPQEMSSEADSNTTSQVRVVSSTKTYQYQQPVQQQKTVTTTRVVQQQGYGMSGDHVNFPVQFDPSQQQQRQFQQQPPLQQHQQYQQQQFMMQSQLPQQPPQPTQRSFNVPLQMSNTPPPTSANPMSQSFVQGPPQGMPQGQAYGPSQPPMGVPFNEFIPTDPSVTASSRPAAAPKSSVPMQYQGPTPAEVKEWPPQVTGVMSVLHVAHKLLIKRLFFLSACIHLQQLFFQQSPFYFICFAGILGGTFCLLY